MKRSIKDIINLLDPVRVAISMAEEEGVSLRELEILCDEIEDLAWKGPSSARVSVMLSALGEEARSYYEVYRKINPGFARRLLTFANSVSGARPNPSLHLNAWGDPIEFYKLKLHRRFMIDGRRLTHMGGLPRVFVKAGPRSYWDHTLVAKKIDPRTIVQPYLGVREV